MKQKFQQLKITPEDSKQQPELFLLQGNRRCTQGYNESEEEKVVKDSMTTPKALPPKAEQFDFAQKVPHKKRTKFCNIIIDDKVLDMTGDEDWLKKRQRSKSQIESTRE